MQALGLLLLASRRLSNLAGETKKIYTIRNTHRIPSSTARASRHGRPRPSARRRALRESVPAPPPTVPRQAPPRFHLRLGPPAHGSKYPKNLDKTIYETASTTVGAIREFAKDHGFVVRGFAPTTRAVKALGERVRSRKRSQFWSDRVEFGSLLIPPSATRPSPENTSPPTRRGSESY